jgi:hypothetical protein
VCGGLNFASSLNGEKKVYGSIVSACSTGGIREIQVHEQRQEIAGHSDRFQDRLSG